MARYDYGLRGPPETTEPRYGRGNFGYAMDFDRRTSSTPRPYRATRPYNMDYVRPRGERYPINHIPYGGEWRGQVGGDDMYRLPYMTQGGTRTNRGVPRPLRYDYPDYGPTYGGRYPDEL